MESVGDQLEPIMEGVRAVFADKHGARERALPLCREALRHSANAIRAVHRQEFAEAEGLIDRAGGLLAEARASLRDHPDTYYAGFVHDAQKEYAEACATLAVIAGRPLPTPQGLGVELPAYLNGLGEAVGELRRHLLDRLRAGDVEHCEGVLAAMDDIYSVLVTMDYPDAMTGGLRRTTDAVRGILERTRGDLTVSVRQRELERKLAEFGKRLG
ncbi:MAG: haloacid dehalogenase [Chloroflexi bacterium RBG_16_68_14]|nr:MAG: haloacid dehalogenase [Chloroflexi bacterium RBG_16_68_14]